MKKILILAIFCILSLPCVSQESYPIRVANTDLIVYDNDEMAEKNNGMLSHEQWFDFGEESYMIMFKKTPVGYKHCLDEVKEILENNSLSFDKDRIDESILIPPFVNGYDDYYEMPQQLKTGNAELNITWIAKDGVPIKLLCNDEIFSVMLLSRFK